MCSLASIPSTFLHLVIQPSRIVHVIEVIKFSVESLPTTNREPVNLERGHEFKRLHSRVQRYAPETLTNPCCFYGNQSARGAAEG